MKNLFCYIKPVKLASVILTTVTCLLLTANSFSQTVCGTLTPNIDFLENINTNSRSVSLNNATIQVFIHIIRKKNGGGNDVISLSDVINGFNQMQSQYYPHNICFVLIGIGFIDKTYYYNYSNDEFDALTGTNIHSNAIDIYIVPNAPYNGRASGIPGRAFVIKKDAVTNGSTMAHEMGHCLGLYHTHETSFCTEAISGSNCSTCGDFVCDTPADPTLSSGNVNSSCIFIGGGGYNPLTANIMSYSDPSCRNDFTVGQKERILDIIPNNSLIQALLAPANITVSNITYPYIVPPFINISSATVVAKNAISTSGNVSIQNGADINFLAEYEITLYPGFEVLAGGEFYAKIDETCPPVIDQRIAHSQNNSIEGRDLVAYYSISDKSEQAILSPISIFPNPNDGKFTLEKSSYVMADIYIYDSMGKLIFQKERIDATTIYIDISEYYSGIYLIKVVLGNTIFVKRVIRN
ncbi:MAG: zinc-dependent metalloprotease [Bacteroidetes bacterium]|nr:zinc-dependent metalloprotease [Bacteroidota bacterium]